MAHEADKSLLKVVKDWMAGRVETFNGAGVATPSAGHLNTALQSGDISDVSISGYAGAVIGLSGPLQDEGWRLRFSASQGKFDYKHTDQPLAVRDRTSDYNHFNLYYGVDSLRADVMAGYNLNIRQIWLKLYAGIAYRSVKADLAGVFNEYGAVDPIDYHVPAGKTADIWLGEDTGFTALAEAWTPLGTQGWASGYLSYSALGSEYGASAKAGWTLPVYFQTMPSIAVGPEIAVFGDEYGSTYRAGAFAALTEGSYEITVSAGVSSNRTDIEESSLYGGVNVYRRF